MLVLTRQKEQIVDVYHKGVHMEIMVTDIQKGGSQVKLGFTAPQSVRIVRREIVDRDNSTGGSDGVPKRGK